MTDPRRVCALAPWLHRPPVTGEDGVYCEAVSRFPWLSLALTDPFGRACWHSIFWALLLLVFLCVYVGIPVSTCLFFGHATSHLPSFFSSPLHMLSSPPAQSSREMMAAGLSHAKGRAQNFTNVKYVSPRSFFREALACFPLTSTLGRHTFLFGLLEFSIFLMLLRSILFRLFRLAAGFSHSQLEEYTRRLVSANKFSSLQHGSSSPSSSPTPIWRKEGVEQIKENVEASAAMTERLLEGQVAVVTGVTSGIGREIALQLAKWGARVYFGARDMEQGRLVAAALNAEVATASSSSFKTASSCFNEKLPKRNSLRRVTSWCKHLVLNALFTSRKPPPTSTIVQEEKEASYTSRIYVHELDLCGAASVRKFSHWVLEETRGQVDLLVNNAGCMYLPEPTLATFAQEGACFEYHLVSNHMGHFLLTQLLLPALKRSAETAYQEGEGNYSTSFKPGRGRIINLSSCIHALHSRNFNVLDVAYTPETARKAAAAIVSDEIAQLRHQSSAEEERWHADNLLKHRNSSGAKNYNPWCAYANSKLCNIWFTKELQRRLLLDSVAASRRDPSNTIASTPMSRELSVNGGTRTAAGELNFHPDSCVAVYAVHPGVVATNLGRVATKHNFLVYMVVLLTRSLFMKTPADGAATSLFLCIAPKNMLLWGGFYADGKPTWVVPAALDKKAQRELWAVSESICRSSGNNSARPAVEGASADAAIP